MRFSILLSLVCLVASVQPIFISAGDPVRRRSGAHMFYDFPFQRCNVPTSRTHVFGLVLKPFWQIRPHWTLACSRCSQRCTTMRCPPAVGHSCWRHDAFQAQRQRLQHTTGWDGNGLFLSEGMLCITWNTLGLVGSVFTRRRHRELKLKYFTKTLG